MVKKRMLEDNVGGMKMALTDNFPSADEETRRVCRQKLAKKRQGDPFLSQDSPFFEMTVATSWLNLTLLLYGLNPSYQENVATLHGRMSVGNDTWTAAEGLAKKLLEKDDNKLFPEGIEYNVDRAKRNLEVYRAQIQN